MTAHHLPPARIQLLQELAHTYGTPLYVYDMEQIKRNFLSFKQAFNARKSLICYALKANSNLSVLRLLAELGSGADCVSIGEVRRALLAGIPAYKIIFSGVGKRDDEIAEALELGILFINVESFEELKRIESIAKSLVDSALGEHSADFGGLEATADHQSSSAPKPPKNYESPTAIPRILEKHKQAECEKSCREQTALESTFSKVDSSPKAESPQARASLDSSKSLSDSKILDEKCGLQGKSQRSYLSGNDCSDFSPLPHFSLKAESPQTQKPTPKPNQAQKPQKARISIRVNPNIDAKTHPYISTGLHENKFGVDMESAKQMYLYAHKSAFLEPIGIHFHIGSQLTELEPLIEASRKIANLARSLVALGIELRFFDIGGGLGICYEDEVPIDLYAYAQGILSTLSGCDWTIICEPGRRIVGDSGLLLTRVISQKSTESKRFVIVDAGMNDLVRPALYGAFHQPIVLRDSVLGEQCGSVADFVKGTTAKVANLPQNPQSSHSPTATPRILEEKQVQMENQTASESSLRALRQQSVAIHTKTTQSLESTFEKSRDCGANAPSPSLRDTAPAVAWQSNSALAESNQINGARKACNLESVQGDWGVKGGIRGDASQVAPLSPLEKNSSKVSLKSSNNAKKVDSSMDCHASTTALARNDRKPSPHTLESTFDNAANLSELAQDSRIFDNNAPNLNEPQSAKTESVFDKKPQAEGFVDDFGGFQGAGEGIYLGDNEQARAAESTKSAAKPTPKPSQAQSSSEQPMPKADIVGPVCESSDTFCKNIALPPLHNGTLLGFENAGAYGYSMASTYNARMRPAEVGIYANGARLIKSRESFEASVADELGLLDSSK